MLNQLQALLVTNIGSRHGQGSRLSPPPNKRLRCRRHLVALGDGLGLVADGLRFFDLAASGKKLGDLGR